MPVLYKYRCPGFSAFITYCYCAIKSGWWLHITNVKCSNFYIDQYFLSLDSALSFLSSLNMGFKPDDGEVG